MRTFISENRKYARIKIFLEIIAWLTLVVLGCLAVTLGLLSIRGASLLCVCLVLGLLVSAWWNFEGGRHPCFLFLGMLFIFQCGRLLGYMTGSPDEPFAVVGQFPFLVSRSSEEITLLLIVLSAICVYAPCRILYRRVVFRAGPEQDWLSGLYWLLLLTLPFAVYKNYLYLSYIRSHGGYIAVYTDTAVIQQSAGVLMRTGALVGTSVLLLLYLFERRAGFMTLLLSLFFIVSSMELLIGFRGKIFVQILVFWFIRNLKAGKKFNLIPLFSAAVVFSVVAVIVAGFREEHAINWLGPLGFVSGEGVSMGVTEMAVEERDMFAKNTGRYLLGGVKSIFGSTDDIFVVDQLISGSGQFQSRLFPWVVLSCGRLSSWRRCCSCRRLAPTGNDALLDLQPLRFLEGRRFNDGVLGLDHLYAAWRVVRSHIRHRQVTACLRRGRRHACAHERLILVVSGNLSGSANP